MKKIRNWLAARWRTLAKIGLVWLVVEGLAAIAALMGVHALLE